MNTFNKIAAVILLSAGTAAAQIHSQSTALPGSVPSGVNYQGRLEQNGVPVNSATTMVFKVMDALSGGNTLWTSGNQTVTVNAGLFNTVIAMPVDPLIGGSPRFMEVTVNGTALTPREPLNAVPYALVAKTVEGAIDISSNNFTLSNGVTNILFVSSQTFRVGIGISTPQERLHVSSGNAIVEYGVYTTTLALSGRAADPTGRAGMMYYNSLNDRLRVYSGATAVWINVATGTAVQQTGDTMLGALNVANTVANTNSIVTSSNIVVNSPGMLQAPGLYIANAAGNLNSIVTSSNIVVTGANTAVVAPFHLGTFVGNGAAITGISDTSKLPLTGGTLSGPGTLTMTGSAANIISGSSFTTSGGIFASGARITGNDLVMTGANSNIIAGSSITTSGGLFGSGARITGNDLVLTGANSNVIAGSSITTSGGLFGSGARITGNDLVMTGANSNIIAGSSITTSGGLFGSGARITGNDLVMTGANSNVIAGSSITTSGGLFGSGAIVSGKVGVGTTGPGYPLEINPADVGGASAGTGLLGLVGVHNTVNRPYLFIKNKTAGTTTTGGVRWLDGDGTESWAIESNRAVGSANLEFNLAGANKITFGSTGNVGIGTVGPASKLHMSSSAFIVDGDGGKLETASNTAPTLGACGAGPTIVGSDVAGKVTIGGGGATACIVTFRTAYTNAPICTVSDETTATTIRPVTTTTALTLTAAAIAAADIVNYICIGLH